MASTPKPFHEWLCKTNFSFLTGASHPEELVERGTKLGYASLCLNDFDGVYGLARTYRALCDLQKEHPKIPTLHYGAEIHFTTDHDLPILLQDTLTLVAKSKEGYRQLCSLLTYAHRNGKDKANLPLDYLLSAQVSDLFAIQPMRGAIRSGRWEEKTREWGLLGEHFRGQLYFAISRHFHPAEDHWIAPTLQVAKQLGAGCLLSQDVFFHHRSAKPMSDLLHAIRTNQILDGCKEHFFPNGERCLHRADELERFFSALPIYADALALSEQLAQQCTFSLSQLRYQYPKEMIPEGIRPQAYLEQLVWQGAQQRYGEYLPEKVRTLLGHELDLIQELAFADYFLTVWDIVGWARSQQILCQGRGSAANSAVCYMLGITSVDPTLFDLLFERFLSKERGDPPDIDVDFEHERREEVIQYIYQRYGRDRAAMVANVICFRRKGAMRAVGKALGIETSLIDQASQLASSRFLRKEDTQTILRELSIDPEQYSIPMGHWIEMTTKLLGFPRHLGIHSGGFLLTDQSLNHLVPQEPATMEGRTVIQWCKDDIEALGFFKIDLLSLGMLTAIRKCFQVIQTSYGVSLDFYAIPQDDRATYGMMQQANTVGTFQIESRAQMSMLPRLKPKCFYDLVIEVAIIRPGPIQGKVIHPYLRRREGLEPITFPDERLRPILSRTLGVAIFQEQAMRIAIAVGNFSPGDANELRKHIGSWNMKSFGMNLNPWLVKLKQGMGDNGLSEHFIQQILGQMEGFAHYGFPESHAVSFALIAYVSCYLKCHFPAAFYASVLNAQPMGFYSPHALLQDARRNQIKVLPLSILHSDWDHQLEKIVQAGRPDQLAIRLGFRLVRGLSEDAAKHLISLRQCGAQWQDFFAFVASTGLYRDDLAALAAAGVFHCFGLSRSDALWKIEAAPFRPIIEVEEKNLHWQAESDHQKIQRDFHAFHTSLEEHPSALIKSKSWCYPVPLDRIFPANALKDLVRNRILHLFGMVLVRQAPPSAKGMVFVTLEDETGFINLAFSPDIYARYHSLVDQAPFLCIEGRLQRASDYHSILVKRVFAQTPSANLIRIGDKTPRTKTTPPPLDGLVTPRSFY